MNLKRIVILASCLIVALMAYVFRDQLFMSAELRQRPELVSELDRLRDPKFSKDPSVVAMALIRLSTPKTPEGKREAISRSNDPNPLIRAAVGRALLQFSIRDIEIEKTIQKLLSDSDPSVRVAVLESFQNQFDAERIAIIEKFLARTDLNPPMTDDEKILAHYSLFATSTVQSKREEQLAFIYPFALDPNSGAQTRAISTLIRVASRDKKALGIVKDELRFAAAVKDRTKIPYPRSRSWPSVYRYLSQVAADEVRPQFSIFAHHPDPHLQTSALTSVYPLCPKNRWEVLRSFQFKLNSTPDQNNWQSSWLSAVDVLGGKEAYSIIQGKFVASSPYFVRSQQIAAKYKADTGADACDDKTKRLTKRIMQNMPMIPRPNPSASPTKKK
jgi:hypothetical protein